LQIVDNHPVKGVLLDIDGVISVGGQALPGSLDAVNRLRSLRIPLKFITNTTRRPRRRIVDDLARHGLGASSSDVYTPAAIAREFLARRNLAPFLITHPDLREDFAGLESGAGEAVVVGDAGEYFTYDFLNMAYRKLVNGAEFLALARNRNFLDRDHELSLDVGPFVAALEYASGKTAVVLGKPAPKFFLDAVDSLGCAAKDAVMIGDDAESDVGGAMAAGLKGILVRTGKYRAGQEDQLPERPTYVADNLEDAVEFLFG
jgi:HAD superfamily hydrolase (TIGR01458 family)